VPSPLLAEMTIRYIVYISKPDKTPLIAALVIAFLGFIAGIIWATKVSKQQSELDYTPPDFDKCDEEKQLGCISQTLYLPQQEKHVNSGRLYIKS
jgi:hypothetical protein